MYNVIIFGTGRTSRIVESGLNKFVNVLCYLDNDSTKSGSTYNGKKVLNPIEAKRLEFDYIIIASQFNEPIYKQLLEIGIKKEKILQFYKYFATCQNHIDWKMQYLYENVNDIEVVATGISYMVTAIREDILLKRIGNIANSSQDLYYDYNLVKYMIEKSGKSFEKMKYAFVGLSYYSFEYDMSLSSMKGNVLLYYDIIGKKHNFENIELSLEEKNNSKKIGNAIFIIDNNGMPVFDWRDDSSSVENKINEEIGRKQALLDCNKNYPNTVRENMEIFEKYLKFLKKNDIKPIVMVCPVSKYYSNYFSKKLDEEFHKIIAGFKEIYQFQFIDYFYSEEFDDEDFYDVSHLNERGAEKFTKILNDIVCW